MTVGEDHVAVAEIRLRPTISSTPGLSRRSPAGGSRRVRAAPGRSCSAQRASTSARAPTSPAGPRSGSATAAAVPASCTSRRRGYSRHRCRSSPPCRVRRSAAGSAWRAPPTSGWPARVAVLRQLRQDRAASGFRAERHAAGVNRPAARQGPALHRAPDRRRGSRKDRARRPAGRTGRVQAAHELAREIADAGPLAVLAIRATMRDGLANSARGAMDREADGAGEALANGGLRRGCPGLRRTPPPEFRGPVKDGTPRSGRTSGAGLPRTGILTSASASGG